MSLVPTGFPSWGDLGHTLLHPSEKPNSFEQSFWGLGYRAGSPAHQFYKGSLLASPLEMGRLWWWEAPSGCGGTVLPFWAVL